MPIMPTPHTKALLASEPPSAFTLCRPPHPALRPFVSKLWLAYQPETGPIAGAREHVLPSGEMHLVFRLSETPLRVFQSPCDERGQTFGHALVGGIRAGFYARAVGTRSYALGAQLRAGASEALFDVPAHHLAGRHTPLDSLWGSASNSMRERLLDLTEPVQQLAQLETYLLQRLACAPTLHPAVMQALRRFEFDADIGEAVRRSGYSHRHFIELFIRSVGLTPKRYCRVRRLQTALRLIGEPRQANLAEVALAAGYSDQPHFNRDFTEFCGLPPERYRQRASHFTHHVAVD